MTDHTSTQTESTRAYAVNQVLANTRIEGHTPSQKFLEDTQAYILGNLNTEQMLEKALQRSGLTK